MSEGVAPRLPDGVVFLPSQRIVSREKRAGTREQGTYPCSLQEMVASGIAADKETQKKSLAWIREQSMDERRVESLANHDPDVVPHLIELV